MSNRTAKSLRVQSLNKSYGIKGGPRIPAVIDFSLDVAPGEFVTLLGPSGCGKTTALRVLAGLEDIDSGEVLLDGRSIARLPPHRRRIGMVFQNYALFPHMSVFENVAYSLRLRRAAEVDVKRDVGDALDVVGLADFSNRLPGQLSGGQQQRVAVARALVMKPDLLLFDEPLSNLDAKLRVQVRSELRRLQRALGTTSLFVTHDQEEAMSLSDRIAVMRAGRVEQIGAPSEIYARPATLFVAGFIGKVNALPGTVVSTNGGRATAECFGHRFDISGAAVTRGDALLLVRPETVLLQPPERTGIAGIVSEIEYLGDRTEYRVRVGETTVAAVRPSLGQEASFTEGARVSLAFAGDSIHLLPAGSV
ncbi:MAG: ABC transporter ATP-binding protein [Rhodospirillales bacterium]|nr:ABC transporter ATP-binding protein [Rhodospirillales bacterium]